MPPAPKLRNNVAKVDLVDRQIEAFRLREGTGVGRFDTHGNESTTISRRIQSSFAHYLKRHHPGDGTKEAICRNYPPSMPRENWEKLCRKNRVRLSNKGLVLDDEAGYLLSAMLQVLEAEEYGRSVDKWQTETIGEDARAILENFITWLEKAGDASSLAGLNQDAYMGIWPIVLKHWRAVGTRNGLKYIQAFMYDTNAKHLFDNPAFDEKGYQILAQDAIEARTTAGAWVINSLSWENTIFRIGPRKGFKLTDEQARELRACVRGASVGSMQEADASLAILMPEVVNDPECLKGILVEGSDRQVYTAAKTAQGKAWVTLVNTLKEDGDTEAVVQLMHEADDFSLKGVKRGDLIFLVSSEDSEIRSRALKLVAAVKDAPEQARGKGRQI